MVQIVNGIMINVEIKIVKIIMVNHIQNVNLLILIVLLDWMVNVLELNHVLILLWEMHVFMV